MDHLSHPEGTSSIEVPYLCLEEWDGGEFTSYPERKGFNKDLFVAFEYGDNPHREIEAFFQSWLYFGFLIEAFKAVEQTVYIEDFIRTSQDGTKYVTTAKLPGLIKRWRDEELGALKIESMLGKIPPLETRIQKFKAICLEVRTYANLLGSEDFRHNEYALGVLDVIDFWPLSPATAMSIFALGECLTGAAKEIFGQPIWEDSFRMRWGPSALLRERLLRKGWCPRDVSNMWFELGIECHYYFSFLTHPSRYGDHSGCTKSTCHWDSIDEAQYQTRHVEPNCNCRHTSCPREVVSILENGGIPVVALMSSETNGGAELRVTRADKVKNFVAISHVWSDGLGNPRENSLPNCQLTRLQGLVNGLYINRDGEAWETVDKISSTLKEWAGLFGYYPDTSKFSSRYPIHFWIDTLCVPVGSKQHRNLAISKMRKTYESAHRVLVLDSWIQEGSRRAPVADRGARLYLSRWRHRLWTFQEGALASNLHFQFQDGSVYSRDLRDEISDMPSIRSVTADNVATQTFYSSARYGYRGFKDTSEPLHERFVEVWKGLSSRNTSNKKDETICLATILGIDPETLLALPAKTNTELYMITFLNMVRVLPTLILFHFYGPKLQQHGFRWAPNSFLGASTSLSPTLLDPACSPASMLNPKGGLSVVLPGIKIDHQSSDIKSRSLVVSFDNHAYWSYIGLVETFGKPFVMTWDPARRYALILSWNLRHLVRSSKVYLVAAALVSFEERDHKDGFHVDYVCPAVVSSWPPFFATLPATLNEPAISYLEGKPSAYTDSSGYWKIPTPALGSWISADQQWTVY